MSMDFQLESSSKISLSVIETALKDYSIFDQLEDRGELLAFTVSPKNNPSLEIEFAQEAEVSSNYWFSTYAYDKESITQFAEAISDIAEKLNCTIYDNQSNSGKITPKEFKEYKKLYTYSSALTDTLNNPELADILSNPNAYAEYEYDADQPDENGNIKVDFIKDKGKLSDLSFEEITDRLQDKYEVLPAGEEGDDWNFVHFFGIIPKVKEARESVPEYRWGSNNDDRSAIWFFVPRDRDEREEVNGMMTLIPIENYSAQSTENRKRMVIEAAATLGFKHVIGLF